MSEEPAKPSNQRNESTSGGDESILPSFIALAFAIILVFLGVWLFTAKQRNQAIQDCFAEHRQDCVPLDTSR